MPTTPGPPKLLTTAELAKATAGGDGYIRTKKNKVLGLALNPDYNPGLPREILFGDGQIVRSSAHLFLESRLAAPVYVKRGPNAWEYLGDYRAVDVREDEASIRKSIKKYGERRHGGPVVGVLYLENVSEPQVVVSGGGFADPATRREVERAAIAFVTDALERRGFTVIDRQRENLGYDLSAVAPSGEFFVEVKGTDSPEPRFFLTRNERRCSEQHTEWRLFIVCNARTAPFLHELTAKEMLRQFGLDPLAWECTRII